MEFFPAGMGVSYNMCDHSPGREKSCCLQGAFPGEQWESSDTSWGKRATGLRHEDWRVFVTQRRLSFPSRKGVIVHIRMAHPYSVHLDVYKEIFISGVSVGAVANSGWIGDMSKQ